MALDLDNARHRATTILKYRPNSSRVMANVTIDTLHKELHEIRNDLALLKHILSEEYELSAWAKKELEKARSTPEADYVSQEEMERRFPSV